MIITDISTAQSLLGKTGRLSHLDLILHRMALRVNGKRRSCGPGYPQRRGWNDRRSTTIRPLPISAPPFAELDRDEPAGAGGRHVILIYNAISFSVVQRRALLGLLRALGVSRRELFIGILGEALLLGLAGTLLGGLLGLRLGSGLVHLVTRTINDLYYVLSVREFFLDPGSLAKGAALGIL